MGNLLNFKEAIMKVASDIVAWSNKKFITKNQGVENAGNVFAIGSDGTVTLLKIGEGLKIENGMLLLDDNN